MSKKLVGCKMGNASVLHSLTVIHLNVPISKGLLSASTLQALSRFSAAHFNATPNIDSMP